MLTHHDGKQAAVLILRHGIMRGVQEEFCNTPFRQKLFAGKDENGDALIDMVLVILDGSTRDLGTSYELINSVIIPNLGSDKTDRILVVINQADVAMKGCYWNYEKNEPVYYSAEQNYHVEELLDLIIDNMPRERRRLVA